jgi:hypothetical protein
MGSLITAILGMAGFALLIIGCVHLMGELKEGEREGIINRGYVGEDDADTNGV